MLMNIKLFLILSVLLLIAPFSVSAQSYSASEQLRNTLLMQIERLVAEVSRLQSILNSRTATGAQAQTKAVTSYQTTLFPVSFETTYMVKNNELVPFTKEGSSVRSLDKQIFTLFGGVLGDGAVSSNIQEFRIFSNNEGDLGAFVENIAGSDKWVVGVNRAGFDSSDPESNKIFADLFVHEYAHILLFKDTSFINSFTENFWTSGDLSHSLAASRLNSSLRFNTLNNYYEKNSTRFVSDYATMNPEEDVAETFVSFVNGGVPTGNSLREKKVIAFYKNYLFTTERTQLRNNLINLSLLK